MVQDYLLTSWFFRRQLVGTVMYVIMYVRLVTLEQVKTRILDSYDPQKMILMTIKGRWGLLRALQDGQNRKESMHPLQGI